MKSVLLIAVLILTYHFSDAQQISLKKGQRIIVKQTSSGDADMSMGMTMKSNADVASTIDVTGEKNNAFEVNNTLTTIRMTMEMMGQKTSYNSDSLSDKNSDLGKALSPSVNKPVKFIINKLTGKVFSQDTSLAKNDDDNPLSSIMQMSGGQNESLLTDAFFMIGTDKKPSSTWVISDSSKEGKTTTKYTILSVNKNEAQINYETNAVVNTTMEQQGSQVTISMDTKTIGKITADLKSSMVNKKTADSDISGTMEVMGQSMVITAKRNTVTTYEFK